MYARLYLKELERKMEKKGEKEWDKTFYNSRIFMMQFTFYHLRALEYSRDICIFPQKFRFQLAITDLSDRNCSRTRQFNRDQLRT